MRNIIIILTLVFLGACHKEDSCPAVIQDYRYAYYDEFGSVHYMHKAKQMDECDCLADCFEIRSAYLQELATLDTASAEYKFKKNFPPTCDCK